MLQLCSTAKSTGSQNFKYFVLGWNSQLKLEMCDAGFQDFCVDFLIVVKFWIFFVVIESEAHTLTHKHRHIKNFRHYFFDIIIKKKPVKNLKKKHSYYLQTSRTQFFPHFLLDSAPQIIRPNDRVFFNSY